MMWQPRTARALGARVRDIVMLGVHGPSDVGTRGAGQHLRAFWRVGSRDNFALAIEARAL